MIFISLNNSECPACLAGGEFSLKYYGGSLCCRTTRRSQNLVFPVLEPLLVSQLFRANLWPFFTHRKEVFHLRPSPLRRSHKHPQHSVFLRKKATCCFHPVIHMLPSLSPQITRLSPCSGANAERAKDKSVTILKLS